MSGKQGSSTEHQHRSSTPGTRAGSGDPTGSSPKPGAPSATGASGASGASASRSSGSGNSSGSNRRRRRHASRLSAAPSDSAGRADHRETTQRSTEQDNNRSKNGSGSGSRSTRRGGRRRSKRSGAARDASRNGATASTNPRTEHQNGQQVGVGGASKRNNSSSGGQGVHSALKAQKVKNPVNAVSAERTEKLKNAGVAPKPGSGRNAGAAPKPGSGPKPGSAAHAANAASTANTASTPATPGTPATAAIPGSPGGSRGSRSAAGHGPQPRSTGTQKSRTGAKSGGARSRTKRLNSANASAARLDRRRNGRGSSSRSMDTRVAARSRTTGGRRSDGRTTGARTLRPGSSFGGTHMPTSIETSAGGLVVSSLAEAVDEHGNVNMDRIYVCLIGRLDRRGRLLWSMPKGHVEQGEDHCATAEREVWEETGITSTVFADLGTIDYWFVSDGIRIHKTVHHHLLEYKDGDLNDEDPEVTEVTWVPASQLVERLAYGDERKLARRAYELLPELARRAAAEGKVTPR